VGESSPYMTRKDAVRTLGFLFFGKCYAYIEELLFRREGFVESCPPSPYSRVHRKKIFSILFHHITLTTDRRLSADLFPSPSA